MTTYTWTKGVPGDWNTAANWLGGVVPNGPAADVVVNAAPAGSSGFYNITLAAGVNETVHSLDLGSTAIGLTIDGTLTFAAGSTGALGREFQSSGVAINNGTIVNAGLMFAYIQTTGNVMFTGNNPIYIAWELQVIDGTATVDTASIGQYDAVNHTLFDGAFDALGSGRTINLGGVIGGLAVDIEHLTGPKPTPTSSYWTQLIFDDPGSQINEWNGTKYVSVESTLKLIDNAAYVVVTNGRGYTTSNALTIGNNGVFEEAGGTFSTGGLTLLAGGLLIGGVSTTGSNPSAGRVAVAGAVTNNGQIVAEGQGIVFQNAITGTGQLTFNRTAPLPGFTTPVAPAIAGTLEVNAVGAGQTVSFLGNDTLILDNYAGFAGAIAGFSASDKIIVNSATAVTSVTYHAGAAGVGTLQLNNGATNLGSLAIAGDFAGNHFLVAANAGGGFAITTAAGTVASPDPLFDAAFYLAHNPDVAAAGVDPYQHYLHFGWKEGRDPSAYFDTNYYLTQNPDVKAAGLDPLLHFEQFGWKEGRQPSLMFDDAKYLAANPGVKAAGVNPLLDYMQTGQSAGRIAFLTGATAAADPLVNTSFYDRQLGATLIPTGVAGAQQAAASYDTTGWKQGLNPDQWFNTNYYLSHNPDVAAAHIDPLVHYETFGWKEGRDPSAAFSTNKYLAAYSDVKAAHFDPLLHYVEFGQNEGRTVFAV